MNGGEPHAWEGLDRNLTRKVMGLRMAHDATMLEDFRGLLTQQRQQLAEHHRQMIGTPPTEAKTMPEDEDGIHVGDKVEHHYHAPPEPAKTSALPGFMTGPTGSKVGKALGIGLPVAGAGAGLLYLGSILGGQGHPPATHPAASPQGYEWKIRVDFDPEKGGLKMTPEETKK